MTSTKFDARDQSNRAAATSETPSSPPLVSPPSGNFLLITLAYLACAFIWGTTWYAIRVCIQPGAYPSFVAAALRFTLSSATLACIWLIVRPKLKDFKFSTMSWIGAAGLLSGLAYGLLYVCEERITGGLAAVISATGPLMATVIAMYSRTERATKSNVIGCLVSLGGVALVFHDRLQVSQDQAWAVGILLFVAFLNSASNVVMKHHANNTVAVASNAIFFAASSCMLWGLALNTGHATIPQPLPQAPTMALLYLTILGTLVAFACFFYLLKHVRLSTAMTLCFVTPMIALVVDAFMEKHAVLSMESYSGIAVVLLGVAICVLFKGRS